MPDTGRMFLCARCRVQVLICRRCDRGQIYCGSGCAGHAREAAQRAAGQRYQTSRPGRFAHAARARRYRARQKIVTHQGSIVTGVGDLLPTEAAMPPIGNESDVVDAAAHAARCHVCRARCPALVRQGFLRRGRRPDTTIRALHDDSS
jgi:hypothetical protein